MVGLGFGVLALGLLVFGVVEQLLSEFLLDFADDVRHNGFQFFINRLVQTFIIDGGRVDNRSFIELAIVFNECLDLVVCFWFYLDALSLVIKLFRFLLDDDFNTSGGSAEQNVEIGFSSKGDLICILIKVAKIEMGGIGFEDFRDASLQFL